jgi:hypothetical protein
VQAPREGEVPVHLSRASGARVLRGQGDRIGRPGTARPVLDPEHRELGKHCLAAHCPAVALVSDFAG